MTSQTKTCQNCQNQFTIEPDDFAFYEKMKVPPPTWCPECRMVRKFVWRNGTTLYNRKCDLCGKHIISIYHPGYTSPIYCSQCYYSDRWDPFSYGIDFDPARPFFEQFGKLLSRVPKAATHIGTGSSTQNINSPYINFAGGNRDCYLIFNSAQNENCGYSRGILKCRDSFDMYFAEQTERSYEGVNINRSAKVMYGQDVFDSFDSYFVTDCVGVQNCFVCVNLRHKSYHFFSKPLPKEEWQERVSNILGSYAKIEETKKRFSEFSKQFPRKENSNYKSVNCSGNYIFESNNCRECFEVFASDSLRYAVFVKRLKDSYDVVGRGFNAELLLETVGVGHGASRIIGSWSVENSHDIEYSFDVRASQYCFWCAGLKHASYCILNKQYGEAEYEKLSERIREELRSKNLYGLFFPVELSPWAYNETIAQDNFPISREEAFGKGFLWQNDIPRTRGRETVEPDSIPDHIRDVPDTFTSEIFRCVQCGYNYNVVRQELDFYRMMVIPFPRQCFFCRHKNRIARRGPFKLFNRVCAKCGKNIQTPYTFDRPEIVYCEACYRQEVV